MRLSPHLLAASLVALALLPASARAADDVTFYATLSQPQVALGDSVTLQIVLSTGQRGAGSASIELPVTPDIEIVSRHRSNSTQINMGGSGSQIINQTVYSLTLLPKRTGTFLIPASKVELGGKTYQTTDLPLKVLPAGAAVPGQPRKKAQPDPDPDPFQQFFGGNPFSGQGIPDPFGGRDPFGEGAPPKEGDLFIRTLLDKKEAYVGEQVTMSIQLFARVDVGGVENIKLPKLDAFWAEDLENPQQITGDIRQIEGVAYRVYLLKRRALFGLKPGKQTIEPIEIDVQSGLSVFGGGGRKSHRVSQAVDLNVLPLPAGAPAGFESTNVGNFKLDLKSTSVGQDGLVHTQLGQPVTLTLTLEGQGNFKNIVLPKLPAVTGLKAFDPTTTDKVSLSRGHFGGKRTQEFLVDPKQTGTFEMPAVVLSLFNPTTAAYETVKTEPIRIEVTAGAGVASGPQAPSNAGANLLNGSLIKPIHVRSTLDAPGVPLSGRPFFVPLLLSPFVLLIGAFGVKQARDLAQKDDPHRRVRTASSRARKQLKALEKHLADGDASAFYGQVSKAIHDCLTDKLGVSAVGLQRPDLKQKLRDAGASEESIQKVDLVLETCDLGRFAPGTGDARREAMAQGLDAVDSIDAQKLRKPEARS
jgi:hypothetical protein